MTFLKLAEIEIRERQRRDYSPQELRLLKESIVARGLMHPPVVRRAAPSAVVLVAGGRRCRAMQELHEEGISFKFGAEPVPEGAIPITWIEDFDPAGNAEAELDENLIRSALTWQEETEARAFIHKLRKRTNPTQTVIETAKETAKIAGTSVMHERQKVANAILLDANKDNPKVLAARNEREAVTAVLDDLTKKYSNKLAERAKAFNTKHTLINGDCLEHMAKLPTGKFSAIICDPPYGIDADKMKKDDLHLYRDDAAYALDVMKHVVQEGFRVTKPKAFLFMFCDFEHFITIRNYAKQQLWSVWRAPLIWQKGTDGHAPWGRSGFVRTYETILFAVKGQAELLLPGGPDVLNFKRPSRAGRVHAAEKPRDLLLHLLKLSTLPGDAVLDPCAGSGSLISAADIHKVNATLIELSETYFEEAKNRTILKEEAPSE
jgi:DNA modification methylase